MNLRKLDLQKLNSATKYPSIPTYHTLGQKGRLTEVVQVEFDGPVSITEKIDGSNARIIWNNDDWIVGSREDLLSAKGDFLYNPAQGIVETLRPLLEKTKVSIGLDDFVIVFFGEVYGGKINKHSKNYTGGDQSKTGFRVFDVLLYLDKEIESMMDWSREEISSWREHGGQPFSPTSSLYKQALTAGFEIVPSIGTKYDLPRSIANTFNWLQVSLGTQTRASLCDKPGMPEGVVVRSADRSKIAKIRFEDYERTLR